ncbi:UvrD-helicase domain-containing protein [Dactylosporangium matsuzakiense]|uniref:DNA 3'-5' helicase n=1 Tax=Dactylosporangium matsuzakiense TaxID=53360 RepID=A0A9W6KN78_9ACTN|nr:ATP-dependent helicase [Dactylosporangium matsuzakiense]GLL05131.1 hypothetical protein GCM10017581_068780 [Dactylosporangium matsuzakiense]
MELDEPRQKILAAEGHLLIEGGPGCGKTTVALLKARNRLDSLEPEQRVLFLSFSRAAVRQIADRMQGLLTRAARRQLEVRTFHSFFLELVRAHGPLLNGHPSAMITPERERQLKADFDGDWTAETHRLAREEGLYVFDRLAGTAARVLTRIAAVRDLYSNTYPLVIVDEFQDTNDDQWQAVRALSQASTIVCLADPDQRIFDHIEGVDEKRIEHVVEALAPERFDLSKDNHRSPGGGLLDYANAVLRNDPTFPKPANVHDIRYGYPTTCEAQVHLVTLRLTKLLEQQLGRTPTIAVLAPVNALVARLSDHMSAEKPYLSRPGMVLPTIDHELNWDPDLSAAAGYVVASIMEWPTMPRAEAVIDTLNAAADYYRIKFTGGVIGARATITTIERAITAIQAGQTVRSRAAGVLLAAFDAGVEFIGDPVADWQTARAHLHGATELEELFHSARLLRLFRATDALVWALTAAWDGTAAYVAAAQVIRTVLANEVLEAAVSEPRTVSLMSMHKSKGKEFDGVVIAEAQHYGHLLEPGWDDSRVQSARRLLRVAITRARTAVVFVRHQGAHPLVG